MAALLRKCVADRKITSVLSHEWACSTKTIHRMVARVRAEWRKDAVSRSSDSARDEVLVQLREAASMAMERGDAGGAARALSEIGKINGLYPSTKLEFSGRHALEVVIADPRDALRRAFERMAPTSASAAAELEPAATEEPGE